jgi:drug/metabolite transporter (DMT)-like permease
LTLLLTILVLTETPTSREIAGGLVMLIGIAIPVLGGSGAGRRSRGPRGVKTPDAARDRLER